MRPINRLGSGSLIRQAYAQGRRARAGSAAAAAFIEGSGPPRVALVASRRVGNAVARNRARRRLRAAVRPLIDRLSPGAIAVVSATAATSSSSFQVLERDVAEILERSGALEPERG